MGDEEGIATALLLGCHIHGSQEGAHLFYPHGPNRNTDVGITARNYTLCGQYGFKTKGDAARAYNEAYIKFALEHADDTQD